MKDLSVKIDEKNGTITITLPYEKNPGLSKSGNTLLVASTRGGVESDTKVNGQNLRINVNAYIYAKPKPAKGEAAA